MNELPIYALDRAVDRPVFLSQALEHRPEGRLASAEVREDPLVLECVVMGDRIAIARADRAESPIVLPHRHRVQAGSRLPRAHRTIADARHQIPQLRQLPAKHVVDIDEVPAGQPPFVRDCVSKAEGSRRGRADSCHASSPLRRSPPSGVGSMPRRSYSSLTAEVIPAPSPGTPRSGSSA